MAEDQTRMAAESFSGTGMEWNVLYDVSEGMDTDTFASTQQWNPFNGDVTAPPTWTHLGITRGIRCAFGKDEAGVTHACIFVFEYSLDHGLLLQQMANEMAVVDSMGLESVQSLTLTDLPAHGIDFCGVNCGLKTCLTAIRFVRPRRLASLAPVCCEMHAVIQYATTHPEDGRFAAILRSKDCTSGHLQVRDLLGKDAWASFVARWMAGDFIAVIYTGMEKKRVKKSMVAGRSFRDRQHSLAAEAWKSLC